MQHHYLPRGSAPISKSTLSQYLVRGYSHNTTPDSEDTRPISPLKEFVVVIVWSLSSVWQFWDPWTLAPQAPLSIWLPRQEYWCGCPFPSTGDFPDPGTKLMLPALQANSLPLNHRESLSRSLNGEKCRFLQHIL